MMHRSVQCDNFEQSYLYLVDKQINEEDTLEGKIYVHGHYVEIKDYHFEGFFEKERGFHAQFKGI